MSDEQLSILDENLTDEEREALKDDSADELEQMTMDELAAYNHEQDNKEDDPKDEVEDVADAEDTGDKPDEKADTKAETDDKPEDAGAKGDDAKPAQSEVEDTTDDVEDDAEPEIEALPQKLNHQAANEKLQGLESTMEDLRTDRLKLAQDLDDGEISALEHRKKLDAIEQEMDEAKEAATDIKLNFKLSQDNATENWFENVVPSFNDQNTIYTTNKTMAKLLDTTVRELQVEAAKSGKNPLSPAILRIAHKRISAEMPQMFSGATQAGKQADKAEKPAGDRKRIPTLADVPAAADDSGLTNSKFAALDKLTGEAYENAIMALTPKEHDEYMNQE